MRLTRFDIQGFQSFRDERSIEIDPHVTLLAGQNNVGKSAALRALRAPVEAQDGGHGNLVFTWTWELTSKELAAPMFDTTGDDGLRVWLSNGGNPHTLEAHFVNGAPSGRVEPSALRCVRLRLPALGAEATGGPQTNLGWNVGPFSESAVGTDALVSLVTTAAQQTVHLGPRLIDELPRPLTPTPQLEGTGRNLGEVILWLSQAGRFDRFEEIEEVLRSAFPGLKGITVPALNTQTSSGQYVGEVRVQYEGGGDPIALRDCGSGVAQMLALAVVVVTSTEPRIILIDEPQAYLHPHAERAMVKLVESVPQHQFVLASHSHVLLSAWPLTRARLLSLEDGATRVSAVLDSEQVLVQLGVSAAELWLVDHLLWVEGPSEQRVFTALAESTLPRDQVATLGIQEMPGASRLMARKRQTAAIVAFCTEAATAIAPVSVRMRFAFDADEKTADFKAQILEASAGQAVFLARRELENYFLDADIIALRVREIAANEEIAVPADEQIVMALRAALDQGDNEGIYPDGLPDSADERVAVAKGSAVLGAIWWELLSADYEKVRDGDALARLALEHKPELLDELSQLLTELFANGETGR